MSRQVHGTVLSHRREKTAVLTLYLFGDIKSTEFLILLTIIIKLRSKNAVSRRTPDGEYAARIDSIMEYTDSIGI